MMNYKQPDELKSELLHGLQVGDSTLVSPDGYIHLPNCDVFKVVVTKAPAQGKTEFTGSDARRMACSCSAAPRVSL